MTSFDLMFRYPWWSVDSKSWIDYARFGFILVPRIKFNGEWDWLHPQRICTSNRSFHKRPPAKHYRTMSPASRRHVDAFLQHLKAPFGSSKRRTVPARYELQEGEAWTREPTDTSPGEVEVVVEPGVENDYVVRMDVNMQVFREIEKQVPAWPWSIHDTVGRRRKGLLT
jgi:hypothetical protein